MAATADAQNKNSGVRKARKKKRGSSHDRLVDAQIARNRKRMRKQKPKKRKR